MPNTLAVVAPITLAAVLTASAAAKFRRPDDVAGWADLGVPGPLRRPWLVRLHPWGELAVAASIVVFGGVIGLFAALVAVALMAAYLWMVWRAFRRRGDASCACFGARVKITVATVSRNTWLTLLAVVAATTSWANPPFGGALAALTPDGRAWLAAAMLAVVTSFMVTWADAAGAVDPPNRPVTLPDPEHVLAPDAGTDDDLEYVRTRTPAVPVSLADGTVVSLRDLAARKPILLMAVSPMCGHCTPVVERVPVWRPLLPEVDIRLLLTIAPEATSWTERSEPQSLHDPGDYVSASISDWPTPTAVLIGSDGMLAGGPVTGFNDIEGFVADIYENLHGHSPR